MDATTIVQLVTDLGAFGFILWLVQRTFSHTIPRLAGSFEKALDKLQATFADQAEKQRQDFKEMVNQQRIDFERMMQREQEIHAAQTDKMVHALEDLTRKVEA